MKTFYVVPFAYVMAILVSCGKGGDNNSTTQPVKPADSTTFSNPLLTSGPDPWVAQKDGYYYYTQTLDNRIALWKTKDISNLKNATIKTVWLPTSGTAYSNNVWAPELHYLQNKWYIYFTADSSGDDATHRLFVIENNADDPTSGTWAFKGKIAEASDNWAIDPSEFEYKGSSYLLWSGWAGKQGGQQNIYIAKLANPWTLAGSRVLISSPTYDWEKNGFPVNEGPEAIVNPDGDLFLTFSASYCGTDDYCLGLLSLKSGGDPLNPSDWTKNPQPVFSTNATGSAYSPGHNGFFLSPDSSENWIIYHANNSAGQGCGDTRNPRIQKFTWNSDGTPNFGTPASIYQTLTKPSGE